MPLLTAIPVSRPTWLPRPGRLTADDVAAIRWAIARFRTPVEGSDRPSWPALPRATVASIASDRSVGSIGSSRSRYSVLSRSSVGSAASAWSLLSVGSLLSFGSAGSILSIGSVGSVLSIGSSGSVLSIGASGGFLSIGNRRFATDRDATDDQVRPLRAVNT